MMTLSPPYYSIEGVVVAPDYSDPRTYYYFPNRPHVPVEDGHPAIRLLVYKENLDDLPPEKESVAGFLYFDTTLEWPDDVLKKVAKKIQDDQHLDMPPRLSPLLFKSGTARLIFLDQQTPPPLPPGAAAPPGPGAGDDQPKPEWVVSLETSGVPSLYGENRAIFSATLTKKATQLLYDAFDGFIPAGVVYDLSFVAMQRAFNVHVSADWEQVYHFLSESFKMDLFVFSTETDKIVDELIEKKIIKIEASLEGVGDEGMENEFNAVRKELQGFVLDTFFKPAPNPDKQDANPIPGQVIDFLGQLRNLGYPHAGYTRRELNSSQIRTVDIDYTVSRAVERRIAPQAHIGVFFEDLGLKKSDVITVVNGEDDFFKEIEFNVSANADFDGDGIFGIGVDVAYGAGNGAGNGEPVATWATLLNKGQQLFKRSAWFDPAAGRQYQYRYQTVFTPGAVPGLAQELNAGWRQDSGNVLVISPNELYQKRRVEFQFAKNFPLALYPQAQIELRYTDPDTAWNFSDSRIIDATVPRGTFAFRTGPGSPQAVSYRYTFVHAGGPVQGDWQTTNSDAVLVMDPRPHLFRVAVLVAGDRSKIQEILLNFRYADPENDILETNFIRVTKDNINQALEWVFAPADPSRTRYEYSQVLMDADGNIVETGWVGSDKSALPVGVVYARRWDVDPELIGPPLSDNGIEKIKLSLHYRDEQNNVSFDKDMVFVEPGKGEPWRLELKDAQARSYTYEVAWVQTNGFERKLGPLSSSDTFLMISSAPPV